MKEKDILKKFNLPYYSKGKTIADAVKQWNNKFKGREDDISKRTHKDGLDRYKQAQEYIKEMNGLNKPQPNQFGLGGNTFDTQTGERYGWDEDLQKEYEAGEALTDTAAGAFGVFGAAARGIMKGGEMIGEGIGGKRGRHTSNTISSFTNPISTQMGIMRNEDATTGEKLSGFLSGGVLTSGLIGNKVADRSLNKADEESVSRDFNTRNNVYKYGGLENGPCGGEGQPPCPEISDKDKEVLRVDNPLGLNVSEDSQGDALMNRMFYKPDDQSNDPIKLGKYKKVNYFDYDKSDPTNMTLKRGSGQTQNNDAIKMQLKNIRKDNPDKDIKYNEFVWGGYDNLASAARNLPQGVKDPKKSSKLGDFLKSDKFKQGAVDLGNTAMRTAPIAANALQLSQLEESDPVRLDRLDARYKPQYADERALINQVNSNVGNLTEGIQRSTSGSVGALRSNLLGAYLNKGRMLGEGYNKMAAINRAQDEKAQDFDFRTDTTNLRQANLEEDMTARDEGAYATEKSRLTGALGTNIGDVGLEGMRSQYAKKMGLLYDSKGRYIGRVDKKSGKFVSAAEEKEPKDYNFSQYGVDEKKFDK